MLFVTAVQAQTIPNIVSFVTDAVGFTGHNMTNYSSTSSTSFWSLFNSQTPSLSEHPSWQTTSMRCQTLPGLVREVTPMPTPNVRNTRRFTFALLSAHMLAKC